MFLIIISVLTVGQMYFEFKIVRALGLEEFNKRFVLGNLAFSILMSVGFGMLFPAAGMTIAAAGLLSTILSQPMYKFYEWYVGQVKPQFEKGKKTYSKHRSTINQTLADLGRLVIGFALIITLPFRILRGAIKLYDQAKEQLHHG